MRNAAADGRRELPEPIRTLMGHGARKLIGVSRIARDINRKPMELMRLAG